MAKNVENRPKPLVFQWFLLPGDPPEGQNSTLLGVVTPPEAQPGGSPGGPKIRHGGHVGPSWVNLGASWAILRASWLCLG